MEIQTPKPILMKFCTHIPTCPRKLLVKFCPKAHSPPGLGGLESLKLKETFLKYVYKTKDIQHVAGQQELFPSNFNIGFWRGLMVMAFG